MAENTEISWCDHTANLWWGCTEVHEGCDNCYARNLAHRWGFEIWGLPGSDGGVRRPIVSALKDLARYQRKAEAAGVMRSVFVGSMMDIFEKPMPLMEADGTKWGNITTDTLRANLFERITIGQFPNLLFLFLTKRPSNINKYIPDAWKEKGAPDNVMFGTSVVNQETADKLIPQLLEVKGRRFLSMEPLLGPVTFRPKAEGINQMMQLMESGDASRPIMLGGIDWVIVGGESGQKARPMHPDWARSLRDQCLEAGVKFHFKQWGEWTYCLNEVETAKAVFVCHDGKTYEKLGEAPGRACLMLKTGKKAAGRELDGKEYNALPFL